MGATSKMTEWSQFFSKTSHSTSQQFNAYFNAYHRCRRSWNWSVLWRPRRPPRTNTKKKYSIHLWGLEYNICIPMADSCWGLTENSKILQSNYPSIIKKKSRKSRDTWSNRQVWPWRTKWSRAKANWILPREFIGHSKHPFSTTQETTLHTDSTKQSIPKSNWWHSL